ncbi:hypothetical protein [Hyphomicrobium sp. ghe19]|uniref:hypothetical protein n=1 Tax=Hyphomicrobium sp. ghe19 TaxID=2682968 RepID=UPI001367575A|nr:hypothetical protein HYPP_03805 [Hyphomicrobium sp. ghe19]
MGSSRYDKPIIPWTKPERDKPDPTDRVAVMIEEAWQELAKVDHFPEDKPDGIVKLISLRNLMPDILR